MILAAGRGERMRPLTDHCPKPLLQVHGKPLIQYHVEALARGGLRDLVVNTAWLGRPDREPLAGQAAARQPEALANEEAPRIHYSHEGLDFGGALETAGGIARALPLLDEVFWLVGWRRVRARLRVFACRAGPVRRRRQAGPPRAWCPTRRTTSRATSACAPTAWCSATRHAALHLLDDRDCCERLCSTRCRPATRRGIKVPMLPLLRAAMDQRQVTAELYTGRWTDVGTPERLAQLNAT